MLFKRQREGSVICSSCGVLVGVSDDRCYNCGRWNPGLWGFGPALRRLGNDLGFVPFVTGGTLTLYAISLLLSRSDLSTGLSPSNEILFALGASGYVPVVRYGRWWTLVTAGWLHGSILHIFFNMIWIRQLTPAIADLYGPGRMMIIYTVGGICGFALSTLGGAYMSNVPIFFLQGGGLTVGASAPLFGLFGSLLYYGRRSGSRHISQTGVYYAVMAGFFGFIMPGIDNYAHAGGFAGGYLISRLLDPLKPERIDHLAIGFVCLVVTLVALIYSFVTAVPMLLQWAG